MIAELLLLMGMTLVSYKMSLKRAMDSHTR
jgi:hypothetical protein